MVSKVHIRKKFLNDDECFNIILDNRKNLKHETINNYHYEKSKYGIPRISLWSMINFLKANLNCNL